MFEENHIVENAVRYEFYNNQSKLFWKLYQ